MTTREVYLNITDIIDRRISDPTTVHLMQKVQEYVNQLETQLAEARSIISGKTFSDERLEARNRVFEWMQKHIYNSKSMSMKFGGGELLADAVKHFKKEKGL